MQGRTRDGSCYERDIETRGPSSGQIYADRVQDTDVKLDRSTV